MRERRPGACFVRHKLDQLVVGEARHRADTALAGVLLAEAFVARQPQPAWVLFQDSVGHHRAEIVRVTDEAFLVF
jgi:hypothetical protein